MHSIHSAGKLFVRNWNDLRYFLKHNLRIWGLEVSTDCFERDRDLENTRPRLRLRFPGPRPRQAQDQQKLVLRQDQVSRPPSLVPPHLPSGSEESVMITSNCFLCFFMKANPSPICCSNLSLSKPLDIYGKYFLLTSITFWKDKNVRWKQCVKAGHTPNGRSTRKDWLLLLCVMI